MSHSTQENSQLSLDEFEEFEKLIQQNTAPDSDDEEKDTSAADSTSLKEPVSPNHQVDTGYQTVGDFDFAQEYVDQDTTTREDSIVSENGSNATVSSKSSLRRTTHLMFQSESSGENDELPIERSTTEQEFTLIPTLSSPHEAAAEVENPESDENKLVATFGTTENFEALLKQQLEDMDQNFSDNDAPQQSIVREQTQQARHSTPAPSSSKINLPRQKKIHNRTTRSPAANRVRKASQKSRAWNPRSHSPGLAESSDDLSVHSEASRNELRRRLRKSHSEKKQEKSITQQLQSDYDDLLTRFAEAENVIDQLRIGAKIDLFASLPNGSGEQPDNKLAASFPLVSGAQNTSPDFPQSGHVASTSSSPRVPRTSRSSQDIDSMIENSLKFPAAASAEFLRIALEHEAKELRGHMESFKLLLDEADVEDVEKRQVLDDIAKSLQKLEADYITAGKEHDAQKRALILSGNASGSEIGDFDPHRKIEGDIYQLRKMLDNLKENILLGPSLPQTPVSSRRYISSDHLTDSGESLDSTRDLDAGFNEQLRRYNKPTLGSDREDHTTASSRNLSSDDDTTVGYLGTSRKNSVSQNSSGIPERFLRPPSSNSTSPSKSVQHSPSSHAGTSPSRSVQNQSSPNKANSSFQQPDSSPDSRHRPKSRLPRPVGTRSHSTPLMLAKKTPSQEMDRDSGFVGSESSRQSFPLRSDRHIQKLSPVHSAPYTQQPRPVPTQRKPAKQEIKQVRSSQKPVKTTKGPKISTASGYSDRERVPYYDDQDLSGFQLPQNEAPTYAPPQQVHKHKPLKSEDGSSTWSTPLRPRPALSQRNFPHGASGDPIYSTAPPQGHHYQQPPPEHSTEKYRPNSRRSITSSSKDSTLDLLRGEIAKLRQEILENKALADAPQKQKFEPPVTRTYTSESQATESPSHRGRRRTKDRRRGSKQYSHASDDSTKTRRDKTAKRDAKIGGDTPITTEQLSPPDTSNDNTNVLKGHWEYVPQYFSPPAVTPVRDIPEPVVHSTPVHAPVVHMDTSYYSPVRFSSPARIYVPASPAVPVIYNSIPVETRTYRRRGSAHLIPVATQTSLMVDENDLPLTRSQLRSPKRSSSVPPLRQSFMDPQLSISLQRAERAANSLRQKSRTMYRSLRDSYNKAALASTYA